MFIREERSENMARRQWKEILEQNLKASDSFEIHCWNDEREEIQMALRYGAAKKTDWEWGSVIAGKVTPAFIHFLLTLPKPAGNDLAENRMTPFFSIFLSNGFSSEHYGTECNQV